MSDCINQKLFEHMTDSYISHSCWWENQDIWLLVWRICIFSNWHTALCIINTLWSAVNVDNASFLTSKKQEYHQDRQCKNHQLDHVEHD